MCKINNNLNKTDDKINKKLVKESFMRKIDFQSVGNGTNENGSKDLMEVTRTLHGDGLVT